MKFFSLLLLACPVVFSSKNFPNLVFKCKTNSPEAKAEFDAEVEKFHPLVDKVYDCGRKHFTASQYDTSKYRDCIANLNLPNRFESKVSNLSASDFRDKISFKESINHAISSVCSSVNIDSNSGFNSYFMTLPIIGFFVVLACMIGFLIYYGKRFTNPTLNVVYERKGQPDLVEIGSGVATPPPAYQDISLQVPVEKN